MEHKKREQWIDPIVAEVRQARDAYTKQFNCDLNAMASDMKKRQREWEALGFQFVNLAPQKLSHHPKKAA